MTGFCYISLANSIYKCGKNVWSCYIMFFIVWLMITATYVMWNLKIVVEPALWANVFPLGPLRALPYAGPFAPLCELQMQRPGPKRPTCTLLPLGALHALLFTDVGISYFISKRAPFLPFHAQALPIFLPFVSPYFLSPAPAATHIFHLHDLLTTATLPLIFGFWLRCQFKAHMSHACFVMPGNVYKCVINLAWFAKLNIYHC
jgi:hypothetical protein